jgi:hypothetical protein
LKIDLTNIGSEYIQNFNLTKKVENRYIVEGMEAEMKIIDRAKYDYLLASTKRGDDRETGQIIVQCGSEDFEKEVFIKHNEGKFDLRNCIATKGPQLSNVLDCVVDKDINIFDYEQSATNTLQGELNRLIYGDSKLNYFGNIDVNITLNECLSIIGGVPDKTSEGYAIEYMSLVCTPKIERFISSVDGFEYDQYLGHEIELLVSYIRLISTTKLSNDWFEDGNGSYYYNPLNFPIVSFGSPNISIYLEVGEFNVTTEYYGYLWKDGLNGKFKDIDISNTYQINPIIEDVFSCTGLSVVSNFLDINADNSQPPNQYYTYAQNNCQNLKIVQSFDIIRENQLQDSFGDSGKISVKDLMHDLCLMFNLNIIPDVENGIIRIEHVSYFTRKGIDLTAQDYEIGEVTINRDEIDSETFQMAQITPDADFYEAKIAYDRKDIYKELNEKTYKTKKLITDVFGTINNEDYNKPEYRSLFFLLSTDGANIIGLNNALTWRNLINLHDMQRPLKTGRLNGNLITFNEMSIGMDLEIKLYGSIKMWNKIWPYNSVKIKQGTFMIIETSYNEEGVLTLKTIK